MRTSNLTTIAEVVEDIIANMSEADKANVINTAEDDLIMFHHGWGTGIRNHYNLWRNQALLNDIGEEHADDASGVIIKAVWEALRGSGETYRKGKIETETLHYYQNKQCLEISTDGGRSIAIDGIDYRVAKAFADALRMQLYSTESYTHPDYEPQVTLQHDVTLKVWKYPKHSANQPNELIQSEDDPQDEDEQESIMKKARERFERAMGRKGSK